MDDSGEIVFRNDTEAPPGSENEYSASEDENENVSKDSPLTCQAGDKEHFENNPETLLEDLASSISQNVKQLQRHVEETISKFEKKLDDLEGHIYTRPVNNSNNSGQIDKSPLGSSVAVNNSSGDYRERREFLEARSGIITTQTNQTFENRDPVRNKLKPQPYDGSEDLDEYLAHFNIVSELNGWNYVTKSLYLASSLKGACLSLLNDLDPRQCRDYDCLIQALQNRYGTKNRAEIFRSKLQTRTQNRNETIPELAQSIRKLTRQAYPSATPEVLDLLALDYFIDALPDTDIRLRLREIGPKSVSDAERTAVRLEAHKVADKTRGRHQVRAVDQGDSKGKTAETFDNLQQQVKALRDEVANLQLQRTNPASFHQGHSDNRGHYFKSQGRRSDRRNYSRFNQSQDRDQRQGNYNRSTRRADVRSQSQGPPYQPQQNRRQ